MRTILASRHFYSDHAFRQRIKGPVEYVLGAVQAVYRRYGEEDADYRPLPQQALVGSAERDGPGTCSRRPTSRAGRAAASWLNTSTVLARDNFAAALAMGTLWADHVRSRRSGPTAAHAGRPAKRSPPPTRRSTPRAGPSTRPTPGGREVSRPEDVVRVLLDLYLPGGVRPEARAKLVAFVGRGQARRAPPSTRRVREAVHAILTMPEYQLA